MDEFSLAAERREVVGKKVKQLRAVGKLPAVLYGRDVESVAIAVDKRDAERLLSQITSSSFVQLELDGKSFPTLVREAQRDVLRGDLLHVDFNVVSMTEVLRTSVSLVLEGEAPALTEHSAILVTGIEEVEVECLPKDLPNRIIVDISGLREVGDAIHVRDLVLPSKITVLNDPDDMVVLVSGIYEAEEEEEEILEEFEEEPEVIERGKRDEEEEGGERE